MTQDGPVFECFIFCRRERADRFGKQLEFVDMERNFTGLCAEDRSTCLNEVADIKHLIEEIQAFFANFVQTEEKLDFACAILNVGKGNFSHCPRRPDASRKSSLYFPALFLSGFKFSNCLDAGVSTLGARRIWFHALSAKLFQFLQTYFFE